MKYDWLIIGSGLFGAVFAREMLNRGQRVLVVEKRGHIGGNVYTQEVEGIPVHRYGAHIFHTDDEGVWQWVQRYARFNRFTNAPLARWRDQLYHLPFNMNTFYQMWGTDTPDKARAKIEEQRREVQGEPRNLAEQAISLVGRDVYERLVKGYTEKQWGRSCEELPAFIIRRLPVRFVWDNNYFSDAHQGIPSGGYTGLVERLLQGAEVRLNTDFFADRQGLMAQARRVLYTGPLDAWFGCRLGPLEWRSLRFETETLPTANYQGNAVINYTEREVPYTRVIEHKHFAIDQPEVLCAPVTVVTREYPAPWQPGDEPYYPVNDSRNNALADAYRALAAREPRVLFGGRLGQFKYMDMDDTVRAALDLAAEVKREE